MSSESKTTSSPESRLDEVIAAYMQAMEDGKAPDREELLARHLDLAAELSAFFADQDQFDRLAAPLRAMKPERRGATPAGQSAGPVLGTRVGYFGDYELLQEIARGGMGVVYKARQRGLNRLVALKMIQVLPTAGAADVRRFQGEAEAAANLDHPNIVPIYEMGEFQGQHYFTMKLFEGGSLAANLSSLAEDQRAAARLLATVADAVHYAHERGILHRDLKPANILLDAKGEPHVTDFGLAKRFGSDAGLTQSGMIVGTPSYMAPEQASGRKAELTTAADVYSLGAILYELLTGWPPFRGETPIGTLRQVAEQEPRPPRYRNPRVSRALETICLKCLAKDPRQRYATALELAEDLRCFLNGKPILARRSFWWPWARVWPRHHKGWVMAAVVGLLLLIALLAARAARMREQQVRALEAFHYAKEQQTLAEAERQLARANQELARQAVDELQSRIAEDDLGVSPRTKPIQSKLIEDALHFYEALIDNKSTDPDIRQRTANAYRQIGVIQQRLGRDEKAEDAYQRAITMYERLLTAFPERHSYKAELVQVQIRLGSLLKSDGRPKEAESSYRQALVLNQKLVELQPDQQGNLYQQAVIHRDLGYLLAQEGRAPEAEQNYRQALSVLERLVQAAPENSQYRSVLATTHSRLGRLSQQSGRLPQSEKEYQQALSLRQKLVTDNPQNADYRRDLADDHDGLGTLLEATGRQQEAEQHYRQAQAIQEKLAADSPNLPDYRSRLATTYGHLAELLRSAGRRAEAEQFSARALAIRQKLAADFPGNPEYHRALDKGKKRQQEADKTGTKQK